MAVISDLRRRVQAVSERSAQATYRPRVVVLEWIDPLFCCGHWSPELVRLAGGLEVVGREGKPSTSIAWTTIQKADPDVMVLACCGFSLQRTLADLPILTGYPGFADLSCVKTGQIFVVDGSAYFSRPGPRLVDSLELLAHLLHPEIHPLPDPVLPPMRLSEPLLAATSSNRLRL